MPTKTSLRRHAALVDRMADALGLDLEEAMMRGDLPPEDLPEMVLRCASCSNPEACENWLARNAAQDGADRPRTTPYYCRNGEVFDDLKRV